MADTKKKTSTVTKRFSDKPKTAKPKDLGKGMAANAATAIRNRRKQLESINY